MKKKHQKEVKNATEPLKEVVESGNRAFFLIIISLTLAVPVFVLPSIIENAFNTPKTLLMLIGSSIMTAIFGSRLLKGKPVSLANTPTNIIVVFIIVLNLISFFYTKNPYFTQIAAILNITCLSIFYFTSLYIDKKQAYTIFIFSIISGLLVSVIVWFQFFGIYLLMKGISPGHIMGTIGNSNYLGAYLIFPLFSAMGMTAVLKGKTRFLLILIFFIIFGAFLFARARSSWLGFFLSFFLFIYLLKRIHEISVFSFFHNYKKQIIVCAVIISSIISFSIGSSSHRLYKIFDYRKVFDSQTLRFRVTKYFPPSIRLFKQSPLFGTGLWSYRNMVYEAQAELNLSDPDFFKNYDAPRPRRAHNEYLEVLNDGGIVAAGVLALFLLIILSHGWNVINNNSLELKYRLITASCFCSLAGILLTALFFFPFRVNSTLLMTVLMMGIMEAVYVRSNSLIFIKHASASKIGSILALFLFLILINVIWHVGIKPLMGELEHFKYVVYLSKKDKDSAKEHLLKAISLDPHNSTYLIHASKLFMDVFHDFGKAGDYAQNSITDFNGDITLWSAYFIKGLNKFRIGSILEAKAAFEKAIYYNPTFEPAQQKLKEVDDIIQKHDRVMIKLR